MRLRFLSIVSVALWLSTVAPLAIVVAWLTGLSVLWTLIASLPFGPGLTRGAWRALRSTDASRRWWWLQSLGALTLLMPLTALASPLTLVAPPRAVAIALMLAWLGVLLHAIARAHRVRLAHLRIATDRLDRLVRMVHLSDVHVGSRDTRFLDALVTQARAQSPDLVVITGDLLDQRSVGHAQLEPLARLDCPVYMSIGNHERYVDLGQALQAIEQTGVRILRDASVDVLGLRLVGIDDRERPDALPALLERWRGDEERFRVLLYHRPDGWDAARAAGFPLMLAGHTHAGQIWPFGLFVRWRYPYLVGHFEKDGRTLYVSPGAGSWGPTLRFGTHSEMTVVELGPASKIAVASDDDSSCQPDVSAQSGPVRTMRTRSP